MYLEGGSACCQNMLSTFPSFAIRPGGPIERWANACSHEAIFGNKKGGELYLTGHGMWLCVDCGFGARLPGPPRCSRGANPVVDA